MHLIIISLDSTVEPTKINAMSTSSSVQLSHCKDCGILLPSSKMVPPHSHDLSVNRMQNKTLTEMVLKTQQVFAYVKTVSQVVTKTFKS